MTFSLVVVQWAAESCERQPECTPISVPNFLRAYDHAIQNRRRPVTQWDIAAMARFLEPSLYRTDSVWRVVPAIIRGMHMVEPSLIPRAMGTLLGNQPFPIDIKMQRSMALSWYRQFEEIHPLKNGNGRMGDIIYNWHMGTLTNPVSPPDLWETT